MMMLFSDDVTRRDDDAVTFDKDYATRDEESEMARHASANMSERDAMRCYAMLFTLRVESAR